MSVDFPPKNITRFPYEPIKFKNYSSFNFPLNFLYISVKVFCVVCKKRCKGDVLRIGQNILHKNCFRCSKCRKNLHEGGFFIRHDRFYCPTDYHKSFGVKCAVCQAFVEGEVVTVLGKTFHQRCFVCKGCGHLFVSGEQATLVGDACYCPSCAPQPSSRKPGQVNGTPSPHGQFNGQSNLPSSKSSTWADDSHRRSRRPSASQGQVRHPSLDARPSPIVPRSITDQLTVQVHSNGYSNGLPESTPRNVPSTLDQIEPTTANLVSASTPGQTMSAGSLPYYYYYPSGALPDESPAQYYYQRPLHGGAPPWVDYGREYPQSYLELASQGLTALNSADELMLDENELDTDDDDDGLPSSTRQSRRRMDTSIPRRNLYVRNRGLSPGSTLMRSGGLAGAGLTRVRSATMPDAHQSRKSAGVNGRSTSTGKPGMAILAEALKRDIRIRPDRSQSPQASRQLSQEARRLAALPGGRLPDSTSLPAIERYDFPAPPSPAVVLLDRRREKRLKQQQEMATSSATSPSAEVTDAADPDSNELTPQAVEKLSRIEREIASLKRVDQRSGIANALIQELESSRRETARPVDLDPISSSRSPSANTELHYKTRYNGHSYTSPSRTTSSNRRGRPYGHTLSYRMDYSSTGGRSGTMSSFPSTPRPGYTKGILHARAISLPRSQQPLQPQNLGNSIGEPTIGQSRQSRPANQPHQSNFRSSSLRPGERLRHHPMSLATTTTTGNSSLLDFDPTGQAPATDVTIGSLTTSAPSIDNDDGTLARGSSSSLAFWSTGLPPSVTGLRPVGSQLYANRAMTMRPIGTSSSPWQRGRAVTMRPATDDGYPSVQSWLRPASKSREIKTYSYEELKNFVNNPVKGIDLKHLENHLTTEDFENLFKMTRKSFQFLPEWKQNDLKKKAQLFV